jgi:hypothetical protein
MAKKHYDLMLEEEKIDALDRWLQAAGMTRSGYVNTLITKSVEAMGLEKITDYSKLSIIELFNMIGGIGKLMKQK